MPIKTPYNIIPILPDGSKSERYNIAGTYPRVRVAVNSPKATPFFPGGLKADIEELLGSEIDIVTENALHQLIRNQILRDARPVLML